ncbi:MAG: hypothetical protein WDN24_17240 [Sphingomonas sp.]
MDKENDDDQPDPPGRSRLPLQSLHLQELRLLSGAGPRLPRGAAPSLLMVRVGAEKLMHAREVLGALIDMQHE